MKWPSFVPIIMLAIGGAASFAIGTPKPTPLARPLEDTLPLTYLGFPSREVPVSESERAAIGVTSMFSRAYDIGSDLGALSLYVGYHASQSGDKRMHSPDVCLPGAGWTPVRSSLISLSLGDSTVHVNRYQMQHDRHAILVYYWFQGRGRVSAGHVEVSFRHLQDALLSRRDEEALVRIVVPIAPHDLDKPLGATGVSADTLAQRFARHIIPALQQALPPMS